MQRNELAAYVQHTRNAHAAYLREFDLELSHSALKLFRACTDRHSISSFFQLCLSFSFPSLELSHEC